ncbi:MAG: hypothetical protein JWL74_199 [Alphaproteobacteria bacterium]|jgi:hypothetical protein|nr:hypothetical protein [Alphaproteobacteria bacterium]
MGWRAGKGNAAAASPFISRNDREKFMRIGISIGGLILLLIILWIIF